MCAIVLSTTFSSAITIANILALLQLDYFSCTLAVVNFCMHHGISQFLYALFQLTTFVCIIAIDKFCMHYCNSINFYMHHCIWKKISTLLQLIPFVCTIAVDSFCMQNCNCNCQFLYALLQFNPNYVCTSSTENIYF